MKPTTKRLLSVAVSISMVSALGFVLAFVFQWPSHFVLGDVEDSRVTLQDLVAGTPASIPLTPWVVLVVATLLASSRRWWGTIGVIVLGLLGMVFVLGGGAKCLGHPTHTSRAWCSQRAASCTGSWDCRYRSAPYWI
jgi:hypothetical protein